MSSNAERIGLLLDKTTDFDKDERYMATSDLCNELSNNIELGPYLETKVCSAVLKQLDDKSNDVQSIAVKCLGILVTKVQENQVSDICSKLCELILHGKAELRDIYSIGLKTILSDVSQKTGGSVATNLCVRLLAGLAKDTETGVKSESIEIMTDLLRRFGHDFATEHETIMNLLMVQLTDTSSLVRKRATGCVGAMGVMASDALLKRLIEHLIQGIKGASDSSDTRTLIQTVGTLSRCAGHRLGTHLDAVIPILADFCGDAEDESMQNEDSNELRENCFHAFESFVNRCHNEITPHMERVLLLVKSFIKYDPNYNYGDSDEEDDQPMDEVEEYSDEDDGDYSDDDDTSWKVRRAALRVLAAIISTRPELLEHLYTSVSPLLISRFKEREESVRMDVLSVFSELLSMTRAVMPANGSPSHQVQSCLEHLRQRLRVIILACTKQLGPKASVGSRCAVLALLTEVSLVLPGQIGEYVDLVLPNLLKAAEDKHSDLKLDTLVYFRLLIDSHDTQVMTKHVDALVNIAIQAAGGDWYKTVAKALGLIESLVRVVRPDNVASLHQKHAVILFEAVLPSLNANDIDQEIKEAAISCMGQLIARLGDQLGSRVNEVLPLFMERLTNEITRVQSMKAIAVIASSSLPLDLSSILSDYIEALSQLLRQQSRTLRQATLDALNNLVVHEGKQVATNLLSGVVAEASTLLVASDLQLCRLTLVLVSNILSSNPSVASTDAILQKLLPNLLVLARSPTIKGATLNSLQMLFAQIAQLNATGIGFETLFSALTTVPEDMSKHSLINVARCMATICVASGPEQQKDAFTKYVTEITAPSSETHRILALYGLGEFGRLITLNGFPDVKPDILANFNNSVGEDVKSAAAYALGSICVGNMSEYLETIVQRLEKGENSYLLLTALREVIVHHGFTVHDGFSSHVDRVLPVLKHLSTRDEEGVRNMVAECIGKLVVAEHSKVIPLVLALTSSDSPLTRWTGVTSVKFAVVSTSNSDTIRPLFANIDPLLKALEDEDLNVRRATLLTLNTTAHHHATFLLPYVKNRVFPVLLKVTEIKLERVVDLGPFKHKVDDGLPLRKAAYAFADTLLDVLPQELDVSAFFPYLRQGLKDQDDVQMLCHQILTKICHMKPGSIVGELDVIIEPLEKTVNKKVKEDQVGTEVERAKDVIRSGLRAVEALSKVRDTDTHPKFRAFYENVSKNKLLASILETIKSE